MHTSASTSASDKIADQVFQGLLEARTFTNPQLLEHELPTETENELRKICEAFANQFRTAIAGREREAGHDLWMTSTREGAGFWDGDWSEPLAEQMTKFANAHPPPLTC